MSNLPEPDLTSASDRTSSDSTSPEALAAAELRYVTDDSPGIQRKRSVKGFRYITPDGKTIRDTPTLTRIKALGIPPAWTDVWICTDEAGHLQATGRDAKGRKQARYHARWREVRSATKFERMMAFGAALPAIRKQVEHDLALPGLPRARVLALIVRLLEATFIRVGNVEYARANKSFGLTTLRDRHVDISGTTVRFQFRGKSGKDHTISLQDRRLAGLIRRCRDLPGNDLFQYLDENGKRQSVTSGDVNTYLQAISGQHFTAKDFRTWGGTVLAVLAFYEIGACDSESQAHKNVVQAIKRVSEQLGNTPAICSKYYMHPVVTRAYHDGSLTRALETFTAQADDATRLQLAENVVITLLSAESTSDRDKPAV